MLIVILLSSLFTTIPGKELRYEDFIYEEQVKTVRLFPATDSPEGKSQSPVVHLNGNQLLLEFDDLQSDRANYYAKILFCNYDWTPANLHDLDFLSEYNEFTINDYFYSNNTYIPYVHYKFLVPRVKIAGNYLLIVYRDGDRDDLMLSKRFMVSSDAAVIKPFTNLGMTAIRASNQQIQFEVSYNGLDIPSPLETVNVVIRQNQRWDNAVRDVKPSFVRQNTKQLEYRFFNDDKSFAAGNEFRFVDFTSMNYPGQNTARLDKNAKPYTLYVATDVPRAGQRYAQYPDINGNYVVLNRDFGEGETNSQYLNVVFTLQSAQQQGDNIYVIGAFNDWKKTPESEMTFKAGVYTCEMLLKQGFYNYAYESATDQSILEGSHFETENLYEILIYNHTFYPEADQLVGYYPLRVNPR
jgi:hypothetical protein